MMIIFILVFLRPFVCLSMRSWLRVNSEHPVFKRLIEKEGKKFLELLPRVMEGL